MANLILLVVLSVLSALFYFILVKACIRFSAVALRHAVDAAPLQKLSAASSEARQHSIFHTIDKLGVMDRSTNILGGIMWFALAVPIILFAGQIGILHSTGSKTVLEVMQSQSPILLVIGFVLLAVYATICVLLMVYIQRMLVPGPRSNKS